MKKFIYLLFAFFSIVAAISVILPKKSINVGDNTITVGDQAKIPGGQWVDVVNSRLLGFPVRCETCVITTGGTIKVISFTSDNKVLVKYKAPGRPHGTPCKTGVKYLIKPEEFIELLNNTQIIASYKMMCDHVIIRLDERVEIPNNVIIRLDERVEITNLDYDETISLTPVVYKSFGSNFKFLKPFDNGNFETCIIDPGGTLRAIAFTSHEKFLVSYTAPINSMIGVYQDLYLIEPGDFVWLMTEQQIEKNITYTREYIKSNRDYRENWEPNVFTPQEEAEFFLYCILGFIFLMIITTRH